MLPVINHQFYTEDKVILSLLCVCKCMFSYNIAAFCVYDNIIFAVVVCLFTSFAMLQG